MKYEKMPPAEVREGDGPTMIEAIETLHQAGVDVRRPPANAYQLNVAPDLSYYPTKGSILRDGADAPFPERGLDTLLGHLRDTGTIPAVDSC